jgi:hypothetical protein
MEKLFFKVATEKHKPFNLDSTFTNQKYVSEVEPNTP